MSKPNLTQALTETKQRKVVLKAIIAEYAPWCTGYGVAYADFKGARVIFNRLRRRAKTEGLIFDYYENNSGYRMCLSTRDLSEYRY